MELTNAKLHEVYERGYTNNPDTMGSFPQHEERRAILDAMPTWEGLEVLELGCGLGTLCNLLALSGAKRVVGVDYSMTAITAAAKTKIENVEFDCRDLHSVEEKFDVVVMQGVLEHLDDPYKDLSDIINRNLKEDGIVITSSPGWLNPRGIVWMTVYYLIRIHMAAVDLNFIFPWDMAKWGKENGFEIEVKSCDQDWGSGQKMLIDYNTRLRTGFFNEQLRVQPYVEGLLKYLEKAGPFFQHTAYTGANIVYKIHRGTT